ncbi:MAG: hypothetical protein AAF585_23625 [Verrucomicrobiota bacterium]
MANDWRIGINDVVDDVVDMPVRRNERDVEASGKPWSQVWEGANLANLNSNIYRSYCFLGDLPDHVFEALSAADEHDQTCFIGPDGLSISANPVCPELLEADEVVCAGLVELSFSGQGFFTWKPISEYKNQYQNAAPLLAARRICREFFPVVRNERFERIAAHLGETFLNQEDYREGDWILTIDESG